jgi:hypothetical protein
MREAGKKARTHANCVSTLHLITWGSRTILRVAHGTTFVQHLPSPKGEIRLAHTKLVPHTSFSCCIPKLAMGCPDMYLSGPSLHVHCVLGATCIAWVVCSPVTSLRASTIAPHQQSL